MEEHGFKGEDGCKPFRLTSELHEPQVETRHFKPKETLESVIL